MSGFWRALGQKHTTGWIVLAVALYATAAAAQTSRYYHSSKVPSESQPKEAESEPAPQLPPAYGKQTPRAGMRARPAAEPAQPIIYEEEPEHLQHVTSEQALKPMKRPATITRATRPAASAHTSTQRVQNAQPKSTYKVAAKPTPQVRGSYSPRVASQPPMPGRGAPIINEGEVISEGEVIPEGVEFMGEPLSDVPDEYGHMHGGGCGHSCHECGGCEMSSCSYCDQWRWCDNLSLFAGVQAFESPLDGDDTGNFGIHEGLNWGMPFWDRIGVGYQLGVQGLQSNFAGDDERNQLFVTTGFFHRASYGRGVQGGVVYDFLSDDDDFSQIRGELSYLLRCNHEFGLWFATAVEGEEDDFGFDDLEPADQYNFFYRRNFQGGGSGRVWLGFSNDRDGLVGGDLSVPLSEKWAFETGFNYLIPDSDESEDEAWSLGLSLVWTPSGWGCSAGPGPYRPLFRVADNATLMVKRHD